MRKIIAFTLLCFFSFFKNEEAICKSNCAVSQKVKVKCCQKAKAACSQKVKVKVKPNNAVSQELPVESNSLRPYDGLFLKI